jgi:hypothetical protein
MGATVVVCGPPTLLPRGLDRLGAGVTYRIDEAIEGADVVMMLRIQHERMKGGFFPSLREYATFFGLDAQRLKRPPRMRSSCIPVRSTGRRDQGDVADGAASVILDQVRSGVAVRMAVLICSAGGDREVLLKNVGSSIRRESRAIRRSVVDGTARAMDGPHRTARSGDSRSEGQCVVPGFIDMHVHLLASRGGWKETIGRKLAGRRGGYGFAFFCP